MRRLFAITLLLGSAATAGCSGEPDATIDTAATDAPRTVGVVDSTLPIDTLLRRFRATLPDTPSVLAGTAQSPEALVNELFTALRAGDTAAVRSLVLTPAEFAWLYYPHTKWTRRPYEMGPELVWFQVSANSEKGLVRLTRRYAGRTLRLESLLCPDSTLAEGPNIVTEGCRVRFAVADSASRDLRLFGSLLNRDGRYKFVSYSNDL
jgi:hypothetical protein